MKTKINWVISLAFLLILITFSSCESLVAPTPTVIASMVTSGPTTTVVATQTIQPSATPMTLTATPIPIINTPTLIPTIAVREREEYAINLIGQCELPCFMGITPGKTYWQDALNLFVPIGKNLTFTSEQNKTKDLLFGTYIDEKTIVPYMLMRMFEQNDIVNEIFTQTEDNKVIHNAFRAYSLENIFEKFGKPSAAFLRLPVGQSEPSAPFYYSLWVLYDQLHFAVHYEGPATQQGDIMRICPSYDHVKTLMILIQSPAAKISLDEDIGMTTDTSLFGHLALERSTNVTVNEFYTNLTANKNYCVESSANLWK